LYVIGLPNMSAKSKRERQDRALSAAQALNLMRATRPPVWIRAPKEGPEYWTGFSRAKLYELAKEGRIRSRSIRGPGQKKGTRLFELESILALIQEAA
jgi:hypothetical protein